MSIIYKVFTTLIFGKVAQLFPFGSVNHAYIGSTLAETFFSFSFIFILPKPFVNVKQRMSTRCGGICHNL